MVAFLLEAGRVQATPVLAAHAPMPAESNLLGR
jgi:hypothetical protein